MMDQIEEKVIPAYPFIQYNDDDDICAFFDATNEMTQEYLTAFNNLALPCWTSESVTGYLLDWIALGIYGEHRPALEIIKEQRQKGDYNSVEYNTIPYANLSNYIAGEHSLVPDDIFKRILTWNFYKGDGFQFSVEWLKRRISRFIHGAAGIDPPVEHTFDVSVMPIDGTFYITIPVYNPLVTSALKAAIEQGYVKLPFIYKYVVEISDVLNRLTVQSVTVNGFDFPLFTPASTFEGATYKLNLEGAVGPVKYEAEGPATVDDGTVIITGRGKVTIKMMDSRGRRASHILNPVRWFTYDGIRRTFSQFMDWCASINARPPTDLEITSPHASSQTNLSRQCNGAIWSEWGDMKTYGWPGDGVEKNSWASWWLNGTTVSQGSNTYVYGTILAGNNAEGFGAGLKSNGTSTAINITNKNGFLNCWIYDINN